MQTWIPARSPLIQYASPPGYLYSGWQLWNRTGNAEWTTTGSSGKLQVALNFTGTGMTFNFMQPIPTTWNSKLLVNGTTPPSSSFSNDTSILNLPLATHYISLDLFPPTPDPFASPSSSQNTGLATFRGITGYTGLQSSTANTIPMPANTTIDDSLWRTGQIALSSGWNMVQGDAATWVNETQWNIMKNISSSFYANTISWTEARGATTNITFNGQMAWVYGLTGDNAGRYDVTLDGNYMGRFNASGEPTMTPDQVLFYASNLSSGNHTVSLRNVDDGKRLSFDRLVSTSNLTPAPALDVPSSSTTSTAATSSAASSSGSSGGKMTSGAIAGVSIVVILLVAGIAAGVLFYLRKKNKDGKWRNFEDESKSSWPLKGSARSWFKLSEPQNSPGYSEDGPKSGAWYSPWSSTKPTSHSFMDLDNSSREQTGMNNNNEKSSFFKMPKIGSPKLGDMTTVSHGMGQRPSISAPIPYPEKAFISDGLDKNGGGMTEREGNDGIEEGGMTPALAAAIAGNTQSPLSRLRNASISAANSNPSPFADPENIHTHIHNHGEYELKDKGQGYNGGRDTIGGIFENYGGSREEGVNVNYDNENEYGQEYDRAGAGYGDERGNEDAYDVYGGTTEEIESDNGRTRVLYGGGQAQKGQGMDFSRGNW